MNRIGKLTVLMLGLWAGAAVAGTASSNEFKLDCRTGLRSAVVPEHIQYSTSWATNLTAAQQADAKAVVKVNPCLKTPPKYLVVDMRGGRNAERWPISYLDEVPSGGWTDEYKTEKLVLRYIPAGSFIMGGRATDYPGASNTNLHMVTLTKPFYIGVFECTQRQWELAMGTRPSFFTNENSYASRPVENVGYRDIRGYDRGVMWPQIDEVDTGSFMAALRDKTHCGRFDLPTEAQWEYACRAGTTTALNSGKDMNAVDVADDSVDEVARYRCNSGYSHYNNLANAFQAYSASTTEFGTAEVGVYKANGWGLFDMHGNVYEFCLDVWSEVQMESIDPHGLIGSADSLRVIRGGAWSSGTKNLSSACGYSYQGVGGQLNPIRGTVGFRICLHNATIYPAADSAMVLVNDSGVSAADWTPTEVGTYQLTHEVQMDGVTVGAMESALFNVEGPELSLSANGELEPGVGIEVKSSFAKATEDGSGEWTIYYTLDGSEPTAESTLYEGPFALEESATVRAVAISEAGVRSDEARADFTLHDTMSVVGAVARQRYPWNGMVDIDCEITGDSNRVYAVEVVATDLDGGTNLPVKTVHMAARPESAPYRLAPGKYRFTWNADADIEGDFDFANVLVSVSAKGGPLVGYARQMTISTDGYTGSETLTNVPVLVRLSTAIKGFDYNDFASPSNGADMVFMDESETQALPYEIDEWHTNGESLVWVKLPELKKGTKFKLAYGGMETGNRELGMGNGEKCQHEVWREYAGVWHMNEDSGAAFDSTEHGLDALPSKGTNELADVSQMVAYENGACGRARVNGNANIEGGNYLLVPSYDSLSIGDNFLVSVWIRVNDIGINPRIITRSTDWEDGWGVEFRSFISEDRLSVNVVGGAHEPYAHVNYIIADKSNWENLVFVFSSSEVRCYSHGVLFEVVNVVSVRDNGLQLAFGNMVNGGGDSLNGQYDEIRLRGGSLSADRIKADYDMIANKNFCTYLVVKEGVGK